MNNPKFQHAMPSDDQLLQLALDYFKAWESRNLERIASFLSDDAQIYNLPTPPPQSKSEWEKSTAEFMKNCTGVIFEVKHVAVGKGGVVFSERVDKLELGGKWIEVAVAVGFEEGVDWFVKGGSLRS